MLKDKQKSNDEDVCDLTTAWIGGTKQTIKQTKRTPTGETEKST